MNSVSLPRSGGWRPRLAVLGLVSSILVGTPLVAAAERGAIGGAEGGGANRAETNRAETSRAERGALKFGRITLEDGLSHRRVYDILQDRQGYLWFATQNGLDRFDGVRFKSFRRELGNPGSLPDSYVLDIHEDRNATLWVGTQSGGLARLDRRSGTFHRYRHDPDDPLSLSSDRVEQIFDDSAGRLWIATAQGFDRLDPDSGTFYRSAPAAHGFSGIVEPSPGRLWVGTDDGLCALETETGQWTVLDPLGFEPELLDRQGRIWAANVSSTVRFTIQPAEDGDGPGPNPGAGGLQPSKTLPLPRAQAILEDGDGAVWFGMFGAGLARWRPGLEGVERFRHDSEDSWSLASDLVLSLLEDRTGILWIGTDSGVSFLEPTRQAFEAHTSDQTGDGELRAVVTLHSDQFGDLWVGSIGHGLARFGSEHQSRRYHYRADDAQSLSHDWVWTILETTGGDLWFGTEVGLDRFVRGSESFQRFQHREDDPRSLRRGRVLALLEASDGGLWIGTASGLDRLVSEDEGFQHSAGAIIDDWPVLVLLEAADGTLWIGLDGGGLVGFDPQTGQAQRFVHDPEDRASLVGDVVTALFQDPSGTLWIGTLDGLAVVRDPSGPGDSRARFEHVQPQGFPADSIAGIEGARDGALWISTSRQLIRLDPASGELSTYGAASGLLTNGYGVRSHGHGRGGELYFGGPDGFISLIPERIPIRRQPPPVVLTDVWIGDRAVPTLDLETSGLTLTHEDRTLTVEFAALDYADPSRNRYAYRLEGFDRDWIEADASERSVRYSNLFPGDYEFRVRASNRDGVWNDSGVSFGLTVRPPPWLSGWAISFYTVALLGALVGYGRWQQGRVDRERAIAERERQLLRDREQLITELESRNAELARFNYTIAHDLRNPLFTIKNFLGVLRRDVDAGRGERLEHDFDRLGKAADRLDRLLQELFEYSRIGVHANQPEAVDLGALARTAVANLAPRFERHSVTVSIAPDLPVVLGDRSRLLEVFQHLVANAVQYRGDPAERRVEIGVMTPATAEPTEMTTVYVRDNGIGVDPRYHDKIFDLFERLDPAASPGTGIGLAMVKRILEVHGGRVWVESEGQDQGSSFFLTLPTHPAPEG